MFRVKICGVTNVADAVAAATTGADAVGLNFFAGSPRYLEADGAESIVRALPPGVLKVGVFVNSTADRVICTMDRLELNAVQLHGDEPAGFVRDLGDRRVIKAFRCGADGLKPLVAWLEQCRKLSRPPDAVLVDGGRPGHYGGSGQQADWQLLAAERQLLGDIPLLLAGGLTASNVARAIEIVMPAGVDTASGVEAGPGRKDHAQVQAFVAAARAALDRMPAKPQAK